MRKVLIIAYYWPPAGGPGVQRVLKFCKYLPDFGWHPVVLTVQNGEYPAADRTLAQEIPPSCRVYSTKAIQPYQWYRKLLGAPQQQPIPTAVLAQTEGLSRKAKLAHWARANLVLPDAHIGWLPYGIRKGLQIVAHEGIDVILSSSPPPTAHLIAQCLARRSGLGWVADFRDPWTDIHYYQHVHRNPVALWLDRKLERAVLESASKVVSISRTYISDYRRKAPRGDYVFLPNGFDRDDFRGIDFAQKPSKFRIMHLGALGEERNPKILFRVLSDLAHADECFGRDVSLVFIGFVGDTVLAQIGQYGLHDVFKRIDYLPHSEALRHMADAALLLLPINQAPDSKGILTGKLFEYLCSRRPILGYGPPDGDAAQIVREAGSGCFLEYEDYEGTKQFLTRSYGQWRRGELRPRGNERVISSFERRELTGRLAGIFEHLTR